MFFSFCSSSNPVLKGMWPEGKLSITEVTKRPLTAATLFKNSMISLVENLACKVKQSGPKHHIQICSGGSTLFTHSESLLTLHITSHSLVHLNDAPCLRRGQVKLKATK